MDCWQSEADKGSEDHKMHCFPHGVHKIWGIESAAKAALEAALEENLVAVLMGPRQDCRWVNQAF